MPPKILRIFDIKIKYDKNPDSIINKKESFK